MNQNTQLEESLGRFQLAVDRLLEKPSLDTALYANLLSLDTRELFDKEQEKSGRVAFQEVRRYAVMVSSCIREFLRIIPSLNGDGWHVDHYIDQMLARRDLVTNMPTY